MYFKCKIILTDIVYIGALNHQHYELTKLMLESGKPVLCEKPFCINAKQLNELVKVKIMYIILR